MLRSGGEFALICDKPSLSGSRWPHVAVFTGSASRINEVHGQCLGKWLAIKRAVDTSTSFCNLALRKAWSSGAITLALKPSIPKKPGSHCTLGHPWVKADPWNAH